MEIIDKEIKCTRSDKFYLYPLGDMHLGVVHCHEKLLTEKVKEIVAQPNAYWLGMGDYADLVVPSDFKRWEGRILAPWMQGSEDNIGPTQLDRVNQILSPIWDKCLGLIEGNHDDSIRKHNHYNFMVELLKKAHEKNKDVKYAGASCFVSLRFVRSGRDTHQIIIHARHGEGHAVTSGARALAVLRLVQSTTNAHIIMMGHLHGQESPDVPQRLLYYREKIKGFDALATMTGAWLRAYMANVPPCYLERWGTPPSKLGCPRFLLEPQRGRITLEKTARTAET